MALWGLAMDGTWSSPQGACSLAGKGSVNPLSQSTVRLAIFGSSEECDLSLAKSGGYGESPGRQVVVINIEKISVGLTDWEV